MNYRIRYNHTSSDKASSLREALWIVRAKGGGTLKRLRHVRCPDGLYLYTSTEDMHRDDTGARAYAVISPEDESP